MQSIRVAHSTSKSNAAYIQRRSIARSAPALKALPFFLNTYHKAQDDREHESGNMLRMLMFGKPGAGKGTLTARLVKKYDILSLSTGDLLRQHIAEGTGVGREAEEIVACGGLLPDEVMLKVLTSKLDTLHNKVYFSHTCSRIVILIASLQHWILDGFPRTLGQGELLDSHLRYLHILYKS
jgi:nucleoside-triphosphate--adenylate kinase